MVKGIPIMSTTISTIQTRRVPIYNNYKSSTPTSTEPNEAELEARVRALENRTYDDSDIKAKMGYDDIPEEESLMSQIIDLGIKDLSFLVVNQNMEKSPVEGATITIMNDEDYLIESVTDINGECIIENVPIGIYNIMASKENVGIDSLTADIVQISNFIMTLHSQQEGEGPK